MVLIGIQTLYDDNYKNCSAPMRIYFANLAFLVGLLIFGLMMATQGPQRFQKCWAILLTISLAVFSLWVLFGLIIMIIIQFASPNCVPPSYLFSSWIVVGLFNWCVITLLYKAFSAWWSRSKIKREGTRLRKVIDKVYDKIYKKSFDVEKFITKNKQAINTFKMTEKEIAILKDKFGIVNKTDQSTIPVNDRKMCVICLGEFEVGDDVILHPHCKHPFHPECLVNWFKEKLSCPICKTPTRIEMLRQLCNPNNKRPSHRDLFLAHDHDESAPLNRIKDKEAAKDDDDDKEDAKDLL